MGTKVKLIIGIAVVVVLAVVAVALFGGGDDNDKPKSAGNGTTKSDDKSDDKSSSDASDDGDSGDAPALRTVAIKRSEGRDAAAQAGALISGPKEIWLRVSAAPKQSVTVNWTLACGTGATSQGAYDVTPPDTRQLKLPKKNPKTCVASASSQIDGEGRLKVAVMRDR